MTTQNVFADAESRLERIGKLAGIDPEIVEILRRPKTTLTASLPVRMDDGTTRMFVGHRCRYNELSARPKAESDSTHRSRLKRSKRSPCG